MLGNIPVVSVPSTQNVSSRPRKEAIYDTEGVPAGAHPTEVVLFSNFAAFNAGAVGGLTKVKGRDTNLSGRSGLEKAQHVFFFSMTAQIQVRNSNIGTNVPNQAIYDQIRQVRDLTDLQFVFTDTPYIRQPYGEFPSSSGPADIATSHALITVANTLSWGVPHRSNDYSVQIMNRPVEITELETFSVQLTQPQANPVLIVPIFHVIFLRGVRLKGITG